MTIEIRNVTLAYNVPTNQRNSLKDTLIAVAQRKALLERRTALKNISINIPKGEIVGVIGRNGAGKSSLLKLIAGILPPSSGSVKTHGSVAAMVELGAGFHPELTAYENILVYGRLLGTDVKTIKERADEVLSWAGLVEKKNDPVRTFSSGMLARLGFAIATDQSPDILLIDEVLAVGDQEFQTKSRLRMNELITSGRTVILVSHDFTTIQQLCSRTIFLDRGEIKKMGESSEVIKAYQEGINS
jgi:ABC-type polysaccharide/polyol phosphate transport system ATPase subunit